MADGDVALAKITPCFENGKSTVFAGLPSGIGAATTELFVLRPTPNGVNARYVLIFLKSPRFIQGGVPVMTGTAGQQRLPRDYFMGVPLPLPPAGEQERIVAKVDELMGLCDDLHVRQAARHRATNRFRRSALRVLTEAPSGCLSEAWERVNANWTGVTSDPETINDLQQAILDLAIRGKLVPQQPSNEPANELLARVGREKLELAKRGEIPKPRSPTPVDPAATPFALPAGWSWAHIEDVCTQIVDCLHRTPPYVPSGYPAIRTCDVEPGRILIDQALRVAESTFRERVSRLAPQAGDVLYSREGGRYGIAAVVPPDMKLCLSQRMMQMRCASPVAPEYVSWFLNSPLGLSQARADVGGSASPHVNIRSIKRFLLPLPPADEQRLIVAMIGELLDLCARLACSLSHAQTAAERVVAASSPGTAERTSG